MEFDLESHKFTNESYDPPIGTQIYRPHPNYDYKSTPRYHGMESNYALLMPPITCKCSRKPFGSYEDIIRNIDVSTLAEGETIQGRFLKTFHKDRKKTCCAETIITSPYYNNIFEEKDAENAARKALVTTGNRIASPNIDIEKYLREIEEEMK